MRRHNLSASFMCRALYNKGYTLIYSKMDLRYFLSYAYSWHIVCFVKQAADRDIYLVILPMRKPNLMRKYIDKNYMTPYPEKSIYLGESCNECLCSHCRMLDHCNEIDRRTDFHCHNYCKGNGEPIKKCWQYEEMVEMRIGDNCKECWCAICDNLDSCGILNGNTRWSCVNYCKGEAQCMTNCSQFYKERDDGRRKEMD